MSKAFLDYNQERWLAQIEELRGELAQAEYELEQADMKLQQAQGKYDIALWKYVAIRDLMREKYWTPYSLHGGKFKHEIKIEDNYTDEREFGKYRFINMKIGDAIVDALGEVKEPQTLDDIVKRLVDGNIGIEEWDLKRPVNAALINTKNIVKTDDGKYIYQKPKVGEKEELPKNEKGVVR
jgi:hypothetical protein